MLQCVIRLVPRMLFAKLFLFVTPLEEVGVRAKRNCLSYSKQRITAVKIDKDSEMQLLRKDNSLAEESKLI